MKTIPAYFIAPQSNGKFSIQKEMEGTVAQKERVIVWDIPTIKQAEHIIKMNLKGRISNIFKPF